MKTSVEYRIQIAVVTMLCVLLLGLMGCRNSRSAPTDMLSGALDAELTLEADGLTYRVTVHLGAVKEGGVRDAEVVFLSPDSLSGMTVRESADGISVTQNGIKTVGGERAGALLLAASLFYPDEIVRTESMAEERTLYTVCHLSDGRALYFDDNTGRLSRIVCDGCRATVAWIEAR